MNLNDEKKNKRIFILLTKFIRTKVILKIICDIILISCFDSVFIQIRFFFKFFFNWFDLVRKF